MAKTPANIHLLFIDTLSVDGVEWCGIVGSDGVTLRFEQENIDVMGANTMGVQRKFRQNRRVYIDIDLLENAFSRLSDLIGDTSADTVYAIPTHTLTFTGSDDEGNTHTGSGTVQFEESQEVAYNNSQEHKLSVTAEFQTVNGIRLTLDGNNY